VKGRIFLKLFAAARVLIAACMLTMNVLIQRAWEGMLSKEIESSMRDKTLMLATRLASTPPEQRIQVLRQVAAEADARATLMAQSGKDLFDSEADASKMENHADRPEVQEAMKGHMASSTRLSRSLHISFLYEAAPVPGGVVRLAYRLSVIDDINRQVRNNLLKSSAVAALLALALAFIAAQSIGRRLVRITAFAERVAAGDLSARIQEESSDEIAHVASALDKTARKLEESFRVVESSRQTLEALLNSMQEPVIAVAEHGRVLWANQRMERLLPSGIRLGEPLVQSARDPEILRAVQTALESRDIVVARAAKIFSGRIFDLTATPMPGGGVVAVMHDQTEIERVEKTRRDFIANVSHELRTPLTSIQGYAETVLDHEKLSDNAHEFLEIIRKNALRMSRLTEDLLVLARVESGERSFKLDPATPQELLDEAVQTFQEIADSHDIELTVMNTASSMVSVDGDAIQQVFSNLIDNAMKYGEEGHKILIGACEREDSVQFFVRDFGAGIPSEHLPRLFERFYRVDKARSRESGGTGLGLAIAKHVVRAHGGTIKAESELNHGATFYFTLPREEVAVRA